MALADALKSVQPSDSAAQTISAPAPRPESVSTPSTTSTESIVPPVQPANTLAADARRVVLEYRKDKPIPVSGAEALSTAQVKLFTKESGDVGVDIATVRKLLRESPEGRSPFQ